MKTIDLSQPERNELIATRRTLKATAYDLSIDSPSLPLISQFIEAIEAELQKRNSAN